MLVTTKKANKDCLNRSQKHNCCVYNDMIFNSLALKHKPGEDICVAMRIIIIILIIIIVKRLLRRIFQKNLIS